MLGLIAFLSGSYDRNEIRSFYQLISHINKIGMEKI
jgi:hypothetical protein